MVLPPQRDPDKSAARDLISAADGEAGTGLGSTRSALANAMVGLKKKYYGRGPTAAKAWVLDNYVFVVLEGGLMPNEETLLAAGREDTVRSYRLCFQEVMGETTMAAVEEIVGRPVLAYHSQIVFDPMRSFEIFVLES